MTVNKNTAVENGGARLEGATSYAYAQGYYDGFTWRDHAVIPEPQSHNTQSPNTQPPMQGGIDWITACNYLEAALASLCNIFVNPDNTLTAEGERAVGCIRNGIVFGRGWNTICKSTVTVGYRCA